MKRRKRRLVLMLFLSLALAASGPGVLSGPDGSLSEGTYDRVYGPSLLPDGGCGSGAGGISVPVPGPGPQESDPPKAWRPPMPEPAKFDIPRPPFTETPRAPRGGVEVPTVTPRVDVTFCLDTTGSMGDEIEVAKDQVLNIAALVEDGDPRPVVRYSLVTFRDLDDEYVTQVFDFMTAEELATILEGVRAIGGGDYPESVSEALHRSVHDVDWDLEASCAIYLIGDAPPHTDYDNGYCYLDAAEDAGELGIVINAIGCSGIRGSEEEFRQVAETTGGSFVYLTYSGGTSGSDGGGAGCGAGGSYEGDAGEGSGGGCGSGEGESQNDLDEVLTGMIQDQARTQGVDYEEDDEG